MKNKPRITAARFARMDIEVIPSDIWVISFNFGEKFGQTSKAHVAKISEFFPDQNQDTYDDKSYYMVSIFSEGKFLPPVKAENMSLSFDQKVDMNEDYIVNFYKNEKDRPLYMGLINRFHPDLLYKDEQYLTNTATFSTGELRDMDAVKKFSRNPGTIRTGVRAYNKFGEILDPFFNVPVFDRKR